MRSMYVSETTDAVMDLDDDFKQRHRSTTTATRNQLPNERSQKQKEIQKPKPNSRELFVQNGLNNIVIDLAT